ncbi:hypothetical protein ACLOJK_034305 [Asimina triloba]
MDEPEDSLFDLFDNDDFDDIGDIGADFDFDRGLWDMSVEESNYLSLGLFKNYIYRDCESKLEVALVGSSRAEKDYSQFDNNRVTLLLRSKPTNLFDMIQKGSCCIIDRKFLDEKESDLGLVEKVKSEFEEDDDLGFLCRELIADEEIDSDPDPDSKSKSDSELKSESDSESNSISYSRFKPDSWFKPELGSDSYSWFKRLHDRQLKTAKILHRRWLLWDLNQTKMRFKLLIYRERHFRPIRANSSFFQGSFRSKTRYKSLRYLTNLFLSNGMLLDQMIRALLRKRWIFPEEMKHGVGAGRMISKRTPHFHAL